MKEDQSDDNYKEPTLGFILLLQSKIQNYNYTYFVVVDVHRNS